MRKPPAVIDIVSANQGPRSQSQRRKLSTENSSRGFFKEKQDDTMYHVDNKPIMSIDCLLNISHYWGSISAVHCKFYMCIVYSISGVTSRFCFYLSKSSRPKKLYLLEVEVCSSEKIYSSKSRK